MSPEPMCSPKRLPEPNRLPEPIDLPVAETRSIWGSSEAHPGPFFRESTWVLLGIRGRSGAHLRSIRSDPQDQICSVAARFGMGSTPCMGGCCDRMGSCTAQHAHMFAVCVVGDWAAGSRMSCGAAHATDTAVRWCPRQGGRWTGTQRCRTRVGPPGAGRARRWVLGS